MANSDTIALLCVVHPKSAEAQNQTRELFGDLVKYYHEPRAQCSTWAYFVPSQRKNAPQQYLKLVSKYQGEHTLVGIEIYTSKKALTQQQEVPAFKRFNEVTKKDNLFAAEEELFAWYPARGYIARKDLAKPFGGDVVVNLVRFVAKEGKTADAVKVLGNFADWVQDNEPDVMTYSIMTRPKAPLEILMFERYKDLKTLGAHGRSGAFKQMLKDLGPYVEMKLMGMSEYQEWNESFVGNVEGGGSSSAKL